MNDANWYCVTDDIREDAEPEEGQTPFAPRRNLQPCVCCGKLSENRWCSNSCFFQEDGYPEDAE